MLVWDISDPVNPKVISHWRTDSDGTHRNSYPGGRYAARGYDIGTVKLKVDQRDAAERAAGVPAGRPRVKFVSAPELVAAASSTD